MVLLAGSIIFVDFSSSFMFPLNPIAPKQQLIVFLLCFFFLVVIAFQFYFLLTF